MTTKDSRDSDPGMRVTAAEIEEIRARAPEIMAEAERRYAHEARVRSRGAELIADERRRQIESEGWTPEHDDGHVRGELVDAGLSYIRSAINTGHPAMQRPPNEWPWEPERWKPSHDRVGDLVKAGALIAAEIDRIQRAQFVASRQQEDSDGE